MCKPRITMILQKLKYTIDTPLELAEKYFAIISVLNNLELAKRELQLLAFTSIRGSIGSETSKQEYVKQYNSSVATVSNIISKLNKTNLLLKEQKRYVVNKSLMLNFNDAIVLGITFEHKKKENVD